MSIKTQIDRISDNVTASLAAVAEKGVAVPTGANSDNLPSLISDISTGVELNFEVVGGTTRPTNPAENTIWVNTNEEITGWVFNDNEPDSASKGVVWIRTGSRPSSSMNALDSSDEIVLNIIKTYQYIEGTWEKSESEIYQSGVWTELNHILTLYDNGNQYFADTGGWIIYNGKAGTGKIYSNYIYVGYSGDSGRDSAAYTANMVNISGYNTLYGEVNISSLSNGFYLGLTQMESALPYYYNYYEAYTKKTSTGTMTIAVDIPDDLAYDEYYIAFSADVTRAYIYKVWLE